MSIGDRLRALRIARGEDQVDVAVACDIGRAQISHIEKDRREMSVPVLQALARHFGVSEHYILHGVDVPANDDERLMDAYRKATPELRTLALSILRYGRERTG